MASSIFLDWSTMAVSIGNTILLLWLGATVLLNAERRDWGVWLSGGSLLLGGAFFVSHSAILGLGLNNFTLRNMVFWWSVGLIPTIIVPFAWYVVILWYAGYWTPVETSLRRRHRYIYYITIAMLIVGLLSLATGIFLMATPTYKYLFLRRMIRSSVGNIPVLGIGFSVYVLLCFGLSADVLRSPAPSGRIMGTQARKRAHPWLVGASVALLIVSLLVTGVMLWIVQDAQRRSVLEIYVESMELISIFDLLISLAIAFATIMLGQAMVSYEVFTGQTLPRRGLLRHWQRVVLLAVVYGFIIGAGRALRVRPTYSLLLTTILMTFFFALVSWRSYVERDRYMASLRPFITSHHFYEQLLTTSTPQEVDFIRPFYVLCADVLETDVAYLASLGPLSALTGPPLSFPENAKPELPSLSALIAHFKTPTDMITAVDPDIYNNTHWAISLWSERGLIGVLLLGQKIGGGLYTHEEVEVARAIGERLIDTQASGEMSQRLMRLQRERLTQTQVIDQQTRRVLHDDILPTLQTALITLSAAPATNGAVADAVTIMTDAHRQISDLLRDMPTISVPDVVRQGLLPALRRAVDIDLAHAFNEIEWQIEPDAAEVINLLPSITAEVLFYAAREVIRNSARYGAGADSALKRPFMLTISATLLTEGLEISIKDNGVGIINNNKSKGAGQGLALHTTMMAVIGGEISISSVPHQYTQVILSLPKDRLPEQ